MGIEVGLSQVALQDVATQDFTSTELSQAPVSVLALISAATSVGTPASDAEQSFGTTDGTNEFAAVHTVNDGVSSTAARRIGKANAGQGETGGSTTDNISHNSFLSDGWRADRSSQGADGYLALAAMFGGSDVTAEAGRLTLDAGSGTYTKSLSNTTLTPNVIIFFTHCSTIASGLTNFHVPSYGIAHDTGTGIVQRHMSWHEEHDVSTANPRAYIGTSDCAAQHTIGAASFDWMLSCTGMSEGQFTASLDSSAGGDEVYFLALQLDNANVSLVDIDTPTTTGLHEETGAGFQPKFVFQVLSMMTALDTHDDTSKAGALAFSLFNANEHFCYAYHNEDGASTTNAQAMCDSKAVHYNADDGTTAYEGTFSQFTSNGWEIDYTTVDATVRKGFALAIGEASSGISGTADQTLPTVTQTASGTLTFTASADQTFASLTQSASGTTSDTVSGSAAQTLPSITQDSTGSLQFSGTSSQLMAAITQSASGGLTFTGSAAQTLSSIIQSASGTTDASRSGSITQTLPVVTQDSTGTLTFTATDGGQELPAVTQTAQETIKDVRPQGSKFHRSGVRTTFRRSHYRSKR